MREEQEKLKKLLHDTVSMLCRNGLHYERHLRIEGVIGITVDDDDVFLVHINNTIAASHDSTSQQIEYSPSVKSEYGYTQRSGGVMRGLNPAMLGVYSSEMSSNTAAAAAGNDHITSTVVTESVDIKPDYVMDEEWVGTNYEESYSSLVYPYPDMDTMSSGNSYQQPAAALVAEHHGKPRVSV